MKILNYAFILTLCLIILIQKWELGAIKKDNNNLYQALHTKSSSMHSEYYSKILGESPFHFSQDSLLEEHHWITNYGYPMWFIKIEVSKDSTLNITTKKFTTKNISTDAGYDSLYYTLHQKMPYSVLQTFKNKLSRVNLLRALEINPHVFCCGKGGMLRYNARLSNKTEVSFETHCYQSIIFAEACDYIFKQINDSELNAIVNSHNIDINKMEN